MQKKSLGRENRISIWHPPRLRSYANIIWLNLKKLPNALLYMFLWIANKALKERKEGVNDYSKSFGTVIVHKVLGSHIVV